MEKHGNTPQSLGSYDASLIPVLTTERLTLRAYGLNDLDDAAHMWADEAVMRFIGGPPRLRKDVWAAMQRSIGTWALLGYGYWAITSRTSGEYLGEIGFLEGLRALEPSIVGMPEAGWCVKRAAWGQGYASEALGGILAWFDDVFGVPTVCIIDHGNLASINVATKCGYVLKTQSTSDVELGIYHRTGV